jgi:hypothetical protein
VGEGVAVPELTQDPAAPQFVDRPHHDVGVQIAGLGHQVQGEVPSHGGGQADYLAGGHGRLVKAAAQYRGEITRRPRGTTAVGRGPHGLDDIKREAPGRPLEQGHFGPGEGPPGDRLGEPGGVGRLERAEVKLGQQSGGPHPVGPVHQQRVLTPVVVA